MEEDGQPGEWTACQGGHVHDPTPRGEDSPEDSPANGTSARVSPADERLVSRVFRVFVSQPQKTLPRMSGYLPQSGIFLPSARRLSEFGRLAALV